MTFWLSYGGGVNSTALAVLLVQGHLPQYQPFRILFCDTGDERRATYTFIREAFIPWLDQRGFCMEVCRPPETVLERFERLSVTGSRIIRACTENGKIVPMRRYREEHGDGPVLLGIDASEAHRRPDDIRPLVDLGIDRDSCSRLIIEAGLPLPVKSGCWHCPFMRVSQIITLARTESCRFDRIVRLEDIATATHGNQPNGRPRLQWGNFTAREWRKHADQKQLFVDESTDDSPCECYDG